MAEPVILSVDDDPQVGSAVQRDLRKKFRPSYRILKANSGSEALDTIGQLKQRDETVALFLVDQRMPEMTGVEFLSEAVKIYPGARRVLLTAYADTEAAISAINDVQIDYYLLKPWDPPEEMLYPPLVDLLDDWQKTYQPKFDGLRLVGNQWAPASHQVKDFLARNHVPYLWLDTDVSDEARKLIDVSGIRETELPCLFFPDGSTLKRPGNREIAERVGLQTIATQPLYDLVIIGAGPAGLAAAVYGASEGLRTIVIESEAPGGQAGMSSRIENYLGFPGGVSGGELTRRAVSQARRFGAEILSTQEVSELVAEGPTRTVKLADGSELHGRAVVISTGVSYRTLEAEGISELTGAGVYYGAAMGEGQAVKGKEVYIVGGANSAGQGAMYFSRYASAVTMLVRGESLSKTMSQYLIDQINGTENIRVVTGTVVQAARGEGHLQQLVLATVPDKTTETVRCDALFIFIGAVPRTEWLGDVIARDQHGFILTGLDARAAAEAQIQRASAPRIKRRTSTWLAIPDEATTSEEPFMLETSLSGVFAVGDVRHGSVKRVASAVGEGSMAVMYVHLYLGSS